MTTALFAVGIFIFMITVYGTVVAGGAAMKRQQEDDGWEILTSSPSDTDDRRPGSRDE
jgi:hypothetical protein